MDAQELRERIIKEQGYDVNSPLVAHGVANFLAPMITWLDEGVLGAYGRMLECDDIDALLLAANALSLELKSELGETKWEEYFFDSAG